MSTNGQTITFEELINEHGEYLRNFIYNRIWVKQDAEDVYQSTLLETVKSIGSFEGRSNPKSWLCGIALNLLKGMSNKNARRLTSYESIYSEEFEEDSTLYTAEDPADIYERECMLDQISEAFEKLPTDIKETANLVIAEGKSYEQAAMILDIPTGTVRSRIHRAREIMRSKVAS